MRIPAMLITMLLLAACSGAPAVIPPAQMTKILWDMIQVDEFATANIALDTAKILKMERMKLYKQVFNIHQISHEEFETSFKYYSAKPDQMKILFDTLAAMGERARHNLYAPKETVSAANGKDSLVKDAAKKDSLKTSTAKDSVLKATAIKDSALKISARKDSVVKAAAARDASLKTSARKDSTAKAAMRKAFLRKASAARDSALKVSARKAALRRDSVAK